MSQFFLTVFNLSIAACWLIAAVLLVRLAFGKRMPRWISCCLWGLVALRLLIPFSVESNLSLVPNSRLQITVEEQITEQSGADWHKNEQQGSESGYISDISRGESADNSLPVYENSEPFGQIGEVSEGTTENIGGVSDVTVDTEIDAPILNENELISPEEAPITEAVVGQEDEIKGITEKTAGILGTVWLCGVAVMLVYWFATYILLKRRVMLSIPCGDRVRKGECIESPFVFGLFRPRIYIPFGLSAQTEECVIAHERAHLKRRDHLVKPFGFFVLSIYWFNPLVWVAYILLCRDIEYACDEKVINDLPHEERKAYAYALLECAVAHKRISACPVAFGETGVKERVENTMKYKKPAFWIILVSVFLCVMVAMLFLTTSAGENDAASSVPETSEQASEAADESADESTDESTDESAEESTEASPEESTLPEQSEPEIDAPLRYINELFAITLIDQADVGKYGNCIRFDTDNTTHSTVLITPKTEIYDLKIFTIPAERSPSGRQQIGEILYEVAKVTAEKPLLADFYIHTDFSRSGISFKDATGETYYYDFNIGSTDGYLYNGRFYVPKVPNDEIPDIEVPNNQGSGSQSGVVNILGNTSGNDRVAKQGSVYYYAEGSTIIKITDVEALESSKLMTLSKGDIYNLNIIGDWMYFFVKESLYEESYIAKVRTDGSGFTKLLQTGEVYELLVVKDTIYFIPVSEHFYPELKNGALYSMSVNGGEVKMLKDGWVSSLCADEDYIYFNYEKTAAPIRTVIYRMNHDGSEITAIWSTERDKHINYIAVENSRIYFGIFDTSDDWVIRFASVDNNGNDYTKYGGFDCYSYMIDVFDGKIYFHGHDYFYNDYRLDGGYGLIEYDLATNELTFLDTNGFESVFYADNGLVFVPEVYSVAVINTATGEKHKISIK